MRRRTDGLFKIRVEDNNICICAFGDYTFLRIKPEQPCLSVLEHPNKLRKGHSSLHHPFVMDKGEQGFDTRDSRSVSKQEVPLSLLLAGKAAMVSCNDIKFALKYPFPEDIFVHEAPGVGEFMMNSRASSLLYKPESKTK